MTTWPTKHFTADDLDAFHSEALSSEMRLHLESCPDCQKLAKLDREVLALLRELPSYAPRADFGERVMSRVTVEKPGPVPVLSFPRLTRRRIAALTALAAGMVASVAWSSSNRVLLDAWLDGTAASLFNWGSALWQNGVAELTAQPWFETVRQVSDTPLRLALAAVAMVGLYGSGIFALRRLVTPSAGTVSNAGA